MKFSVSPSLILQKNALVWVHCIMYGHGLACGMEKRNKFTLNWWNIKMWEHDTRMLAYKRIARYPDLYYFIYTVRNAVAYSLNIIPCFLVGFHWEQHITEERKKSSCEVSLVYKASRYSERDDGCVGSSDRETNAMWNGKRKIFIIKARISLFIQTELEIHSLFSPSVFSIE